MGGEDSVAFANDANGEAVANYRRFNGRHSAEKPMTSVTASRIFPTKK
jgi:hypothetical protein